MFRRVRLGRKLVVVILVLTLTPLVITSGYAYAKTRDALADVVVRQLESLANAQQGRVEAIIGSDLERLEFVAGDALLRDAAAAAVDPAGDRTRLTRVLETVIERRTSVVAAAVHDPRSGALVASAGSGGASPSAHELAVAAGRPAVALPARADGTPVLRALGPIATEGGTLVLVLDSDATDLLAVVLDTTGLGSTGETLLIEAAEDGPRYLTPRRFETQLRGEEASGNATVRRVPPEAGASTAAAQGQEALFLDTLDYRRIHVVAASRTLPSGWGLVVKIDADEAFADVAALRRFSIAALAVTAVVVTVAAVSITRSITRPVERLTDIAHRISTGRTGLRADESAGGEVGDLAVSFNKMTQALADLNWDLTKKVEERTQELRRSNEELQRFAYVASHDLQEPLRIVASFTQLLAQRYKGRLDRDADELIDYAVDGANRMRALIEDLLAYSRVGGQELHRSRVPLDDVLERVRATLDPTIRETGASVTHDALPVVSADPMQIEQLLQNLVANAIKFRRPDTPTRVHVSARRGDDGAWEIGVEDNGIGIRPEHQDRIFVIFQRLHSREEYAGTGIGLAICHRIVERHGGRIWVESSPGAGSTFRFTLPEPHSLRGQP